jgi:hypothetical protein
VDRFALVRYLDDSRRNVRAAHVREIVDDRLRLHLELLAEFRHDQMRAFLAALWLADETPNVSALVKRLEKSKVWQHSRRDQDEVWRFLASLIPASDVQELWRWAIDDPDRGYLQNALKERAWLSRLTLTIEADKAQPTAARARA